MDTISGQTIWPQVAHHTTSQPDMKRVVPQARPRIALVICEPTAWFQFQGLRHANWTGLDFDDYKSSVRNFFTYNVGLAPQQSNVMGAVFERLIGLQPLLLSFMHKLAGHVANAKSGTTGPVYVLRVPATLATTVRSLCLAAWPKAAVSMAACGTVAEAEKAAADLEASALPFCSLLFPNA